MSCVKTNLKNTRPRSHYVETETETTTNRSRDFYQCFLSSSFQEFLFYIIKHEDLIFDNILSCFENEKHQTRVLLLLELVSDAYLTKNQTEYLQSST